MILIVSDDMTRRTLLALVLLSLAAIDAKAEPPPKTGAYHVAHGFIDDPLAISPDGKTFAFFVTDGATHAELHFWTPARDGSPARDVSFPHDSITPERVDFLDGTRLLVVDRDPTSGLARARVYGPKGAEKERLGPADAIELATVAGLPAIVTYSRSENARGVAHALAAYRRDNLKLIARRAISQAPDHSVAAIDKLAGPFQPQAFVDGNATLIALRPGAFDATKDVRAPSRCARIDVFQAVVSSEHDIGEPMKWAALVDRRAKHPGESRFLQLSDDLRQLELVDETDRVRPIALPTPLRKYDTTTLAYRPDGPDRLAFTLQIDPVNPDAVAAQKADADWIDLFRVDVKSAAVAQVARIPGEKRHARWRLVDGTLLLLRQHKGFARGGVDLEAYAVPVAAP